jgi:hypothetical protein
MRTPIFILLCLLAAIPCQARIIYVDADANGADDGSSWADAYNYLQNALADANSNVDVNEIWVAQGIYTPDSNSADPNGSGDREATFQLISGVALYGGFSSGGGTWEQRDPNAIWIDGDYHLKSQGWRWGTQRKVWTWDDVTSRCIDAGNPGSPLSEELLSVPDDPNNEWGQNLRINMGVYGGTAEASMAPYDWALLADLTNDGIVDFVDFGHWAENWLISGSELPGDLDRNGTVDILDFALLAQDWFEETSWHEPEI